MAKKILIVVGVLVVILGIAFIYLNHRNRTLSPPQEEVYESSEGLTFKVKYSSPSVRNRLIFGTEADGALQPFGKYWRLGANESTEIEFNKDLMVGTHELKAGTYKVYCYPDANEFAFCFAPADGAWGAMEPDAEDELFRMNVPVEHLETPAEQFVINMRNKGGVLYMLCDFSDYRLPVPFEIKD
ncbi:DUF2911 domain-containing protein [bacterium]|nr:DUF2911 domain-containing protein [bacterium]